MSERHGEPHRAGGLGDQPPDGLPSMWEAKEVVSDTQDLSP